MARQTIKEVSVKQVEIVAHDLARELMEWGEPIPAFNTRFPDVLESCLKTPFQKFEGKSLYRGIVGKGGALFYFMIKNHPFQNGNKRVAVMTLLYFLYRQSKWLDVDNDTLYRFANQVAESEAIKTHSEMRKIRLFIRKHLINYSVEAIEKTLG